MEDSERIFTELIRSIERSRSEVMQMIRDREKAEVRRAEGPLEQLQQELDDLRRRDTELEQLLHTDDHIRFLQVTDLKKRNFRMLLISQADFCWSTEFYIILNQFVLSLFLSLKIFRNSKCAWPLENFIDFDLSIYVFL